MTRNGHDTSFVGPSVGEEGDSVIQSNQELILCLFFCYHGETMETVTDFIFLGTKITVDGDCSHEIKRHLLLGRKAMTNVDSTLKNRDITLLTKVHLVKGMVFPVVMYGCKSWTIKKAECRGIDAFDLCCWKDS